MEITKQEKQEIIIIYNLLLNIEQKNQHNKKCLQACQEARNLALDLLKNKSTKNYLLKITKHTGKMQGINSLSTYKYICDTCMQLKDNKKLICNKCYADRTLAQYKQLAPALIYNTLLLKYTQLSARQLPVINDLYFRFESFADLQNIQHLRNLYKIARFNPRCHFALWTKNYKLLMQEKAPRNVNIILSSPLLNAVLPAQLRDIVKRKTSAKNIKVFSVYDGDNIKAAGQNCAQKCLTCLKCYKASDKTIFINEKLK